MSMKVVTGAGTVPGVFFKVHGNGRPGAGNPLGAVAP